MAIAIEADVEEKQRKSTSLMNLVALAVILAVVGVGSWQLFSFLQSARKHIQNPAIGRLLSETNPELFAREMKEHRDAQAADRAWIETQRDNPEWIAAQKADREWLETQQHNASRGR